MKLRRAEAHVNKRHGGGRELRKGFWLLGAFGGTVGDKKGFNCSRGTVWFQQPLLLWPEG